MTRRLAVALLAGFATLAAGPPQSPEAVAQQFYDTRIAIGVSGGVPDAAFRAKLAPFLTPALLKALEDADAGEARHFKATNNEEPPLVEGDLFSSLFEGPTSAEVGACVATAEVVTCDAALTYIDARDGKATAWTDKVLLKKTDAGWRVDDLVYGGTWDFGPKGKLSDILNDVANERP